VAFGPPERAAPTKWALVVGISDYIHFGDEIGGDLPGAANDARAMADVLVNKYGFPPGNVKLILDHAATRERLVVRALRLAALRGPARRPGLTIYFAGHGSQAWDLDGDEPDGLDETFCPADVMRGNTEMDIIDDEMAVWLDQLPTDNIVVVWDKCHAASSSRAVTPFARPRSLARNVAADVPRPENAPEPGAATYDDTPQPGILEIAAAQSHEVALDVAFPARDERREHMWGGAFTTPFVQNLWNAPPGASYAEVFHQTVSDMRRDRFTQEPAIQEKPLRDRAVFRLDTPGAGAAGADVASNARVMGQSGSADFVISGGDRARMTTGSIYAVGEHLLEITHVDADRAGARVTGAARPQLDTESRAQLVAYRYPPPRLRVQVAALHRDVRSSLAATLNAVPGLDLVDDPAAFAHLSVHPLQDHYVVLNLEGLARDSVPATVPGADEHLAQLLKREYGQFQLAELENPARPFEVAFAFGNGRNDFQVGEALSFQVRSERDGYLTIVDLSAEGKTTVIFPNELVPDGRIHGGRTVTFPSPDMGIDFVAQEPVGRGVVRAFVTERPLELSFTTGSAEDAQEIWAALAAAAGPAPVAGKDDVVPVTNWATSAIAYEIWHR
jgi:hypothetical protein